MCTVNPDAIWAQPGASHWLADFCGRKDEGSF